VSVDKTIKPVANLTNWRFEWLSQLLVLQTSC